MKLINDFAIALVHPSRYKELLGNRIWRVILYIAVLLIISSVTMISASKELYGILEKYYTSNIPEFTFENQTLKSEKKFDLDFAGMKLMIDTDNQLSAADFGNAFNGALFDSDSMLLKAGTEEVVEAKYSELTSADTKFTKASLMTYMPVLKNIINFVGLFWFIMSIPMFLFGALITALLSKLFTNLMPSNSMSLKFSQIYKLAVYSRGLPILASMILSMFIGGIPSIISVMLSVFILNRALTAIMSSQNV